MRAHERRMYIIIHCIRLTTQSLFWAVIDTPAAGSFNCRGGPTGLATLTLTFYTERVIIPPFFAFNCFIKSEKFQFKTTCVYLNNFQIFQKELSLKLQCH